MNPTKQVSKKEKLPVSGKRKVNFALFKDASPKGKASHSIIGIEEIARMKEKAAKVKLELDEAKRQKEDVERALEDQKAINKSMIDSVHRLEEIESDLRSSLEKETTVSSDRKSLISTLEDEKKSLLKQIADLSETITLKSKECAFLETDLSEKKAQIIVLDDRLKDTAQKMDETALEILGLESKNQALLLSLSRLGEEYTEMKNNLFSMTEVKEKAETLQSELDAEKSERSKAMLEIQQLSGLESIDSWKKLGDMLEAARKELESTTGNNVDLRNELQEWKDALGKERAISAELGQKIIDLEQRISSVFESMRITTGANKKLELALEKEFETGSKLSEIIRKLDIKVSDFTTDLELAKEKISSLQNDKDELISQVEKLQPEAVKKREEELVSELTILKRNQESLNKIKEEHAKKQTELEGNNNEVRSQLGIFQSRLNTAETELRKAVATNNVFVTANMNLNQKVKEFEAELKNIKETLMARESELKKNAKALETETARANGLDSELAQAKKALEEGKAEIERLINENGLMRERAAKDQETIGSQDSKIKDISSQLDSAYSANEQLKALNFDLIQNATKANERAEQTDALIADALSEARSEFDSERKTLTEIFAEEIEKLKKTITELNDTIKTMPKSNEEAAERTKAAEESASKMKRERNSIEIDANESRKALTALKEPLKHMIKELETLGDSKIPLIGAATIRELLLKYSRLRQ